MMRFNRLKNRAGPIHKERDSRRVGFVMDFTRGRRTRTASWGLVLVCIEDKFGGRYSFVCRIIVSG